MSRIVSVALVLAAPALLASCYSFAEPSFHPGDARQTVNAIARHGVTITSIVPGSSACEDPSLKANAMQLVVVDPGDGVTRDVWLYTFREKGWPTTEAPVDDCQAAFAAGQPGATVTRVDVPVYRAFGADWTDELADDVRAGLEDASVLGRPG
ncbi:MAG: hypothetical protein KF809_10740 [Chloroflexi bacterium]|nr:hypothetical protein [Chloroflexota bacterium]